jgi:hypothetical protein
MPGIPAAILDLKNMFKMAEQQDRSVAGLLPVIPATLEVETEGSQIQDSLCNDSEILSQTTTKTR